MADPTNVTVVIVSGVYAIKVGETAIIPIAGSKGTLKIGTDSLGVYAEGKFRATLDPPIDI